MSQQSIGKRGGKDESLSRKGRTCAADRNPGTGIRASAVQPSVPGGCAQGSGQFLTTILLVVYVRHPRLAQDLTLRS